MPNPFSILHVVPSFQVSRNGGVAVSALAWAKAQASVGYPVGVYLFLEGTSFIVGPSDMELVGESPDQPILSAIEILRRLQPDIIHHHTSRGLADTQQLRQQYDAPLVVTLHALHHVLHQMGLTDSQDALTQEAAAVAQADHLIAVSESEAQFMSACFPATADHTSVIGHGIDDTEFARDTASNRQASTQATVLFCGRLDHPYKGIHELCAAIPRVLKQAPKTRFILVGGAKVDEHKPSNSLVSLPEDCLDQVHLTGWQTPEQTRAWYARADILVVPSIYEPFGLVVQEGMLHGMAVAAAQAGGPEDIIDDEVTGLLFPPRNVDALVAALLRLVTEPTLRLSLGNAATLEVRKRWNWAKLVEQMDAVYRPLLRSPAPR